MPVSSMNIWFKRRSWMKDIGVSCTVTFNCFNGLGPALSGDGFTSVSGEAACSACCGTLPLNWNNNSSDTKTIMIVTSVFLNCGIALSLPSVPHFS